MAALLRLSVDQGASFRRVFTYENPPDTPVNLTGYEARAQIRDRPGGALLADLDVAISNALAGQVTLSIPSDTSAGWTWEQGYYDLFLYPTGGVGDIIRLVEGTVVLNKRVTVL